MDRLVRIGDFARIGGVSVKTLRFYAEKGLLAPARIDPETGYRYYRVDQVEALSLIVNLRTAGFTIAEIDQTLRLASDKKALRQRIKAKRKALVAEQSAVNDRIAVADALTRCLQANTPECLGQLRLTRIAPQLAHTRTPRKDGGGSNAITRLFEQAEAAVAQHSRRADVPPFLILGEPAQMEVCIPITKPTSGLNSKLVRGYDLACSIVYEGDYRQTATVAREIETWVATAGFVPDGPMREIYHRFGADQEGYSLPAKVLADRSGDYLTEVSLPIVPVHS